MPKHMKYYWALVAATLTTYLTMIFWSLPKISAQAAGLVAFDMRPAGYSESEAREFMAALDPEGVAFYLDVQHKLDTLYPVLLTATIGFGIYFLTARFPLLLRWVLSLFPVTILVLEFLENAAVARILQSDIATLSAEMIDTASRYSQMKAVFTSLGFLLLLVLLALYWVQAWKGRRAA